MPGEDGLMAVFERAGFCGLSIGKFWHEVEWRRFYSVAGASR